MSSYTVYIFNRRGASARIALDFDEDNDAIRAMTDYGSGLAIELRQDDRLVKRFEVGETRPEWPPDGPL